MVELLKCPTSSHAAWSATENLGWRGTPQSTPTLAKENSNKVAARKNVNTASINTLNKATVRLGFIGLGLMGSRLTRRLHSSGWKIQAWNRSSEPTKML